MHLVEPGAGVLEGTRPGLEKLLDSSDPAVSGAAITTVPMFKDLGLARRVIDAWERHSAVEGFEAGCLSALRILAKQRLKEAEKKAHPAKSDRECWTAAEDRVKQVMTELGKAPADWKAWWEK
jgi:hypothetical protein